MRILVTGGLGFVGSTIVDQYLAAGHEVIVVDTIHNAYGEQLVRQNKHVKCYQASIVNQDHIRRIFRDVRPDIVNHQAAQSSVDVSANNPLLDAQINIEGLLTILMNCTSTGVQKIIFASSGTVYGTPERIPVDETFPLHPQSPYGITKAAGEWYIRYWQQTYGLSYTILRNSNIYGPHQNAGGTSGVIATFARRFLEHQPITIHGSGEQQKDFVYVNDVAHANLLALERGTNNVFCIATGAGTSINRIYQLLSEVVGYQVEIVRTPAHGEDISCTYFSPKKAEHLLQWKPLVSLDEGIRTTIYFFRRELCAA
jgi:UDP-glucose 4-epimerase